MKYFALFGLSLSLVLLTLNAYSQTNTFPLTGNVGIGTTTPASNLEVANSSGAVLTISTNKINGNSTSPLKPRIDFLGYQNSNKARITTTEESYNTNGSKFSILLNDGTNATSLVERFTILQNGNVGIGTTAPTTKLQIVTGNAEGISWKYLTTYGISSIDNVFDSGADAGNKMIFKVNNAAGTSNIIMTLLGSGNVGIGTTSPVTKLDIKQATNIHFGIRDGQADPTAVQLNAYNEAGVANIPMEFKASKFNFTTGNVGIGLVWPGANLDVRGANTITDSYGNLFVSTNTAQAANTGGQISFGSSVKDDGTGSTSLAGIAGRKENGTANDCSGYLVLSTQPGATQILTERMRITSAGNVLIGKTTQTNSSYKLDVSGTIRANEVVVNTTGADLVFAPDYKLISLREVEKYIEENKHLPDMAPASEMIENGINVSEMQTKLLQKIEELTIYAIEQNKKIELLEKEINKLKEK